MFATRLRRNTYWPGQQEQQYSPAADCVRWAKCTLIGVTDDHAADVAALWQAHEQTPFPARRRSMDANGVEMVTLDADVAGCVAAWLRNHGRLDRRRRATLEARLGDLAHAKADFDSEEAVHWQRLRDVIGLPLSVN